MIAIERKKLELVLEALEAATRYGAGDFEDAKDAIKEALAQTEQERTPEDQHFCYCGPAASLQMVSGGAAPEGYLGTVTLLIDGEYVEYVKAQPPLPVQEPAFYTNKRGSQPVAPWGKSEDYCIPLYYAPNRTARV